MHENAAREGESFDGKGASAKRLKERKGARLAENDGPHVLPNAIARPPKSAARASNLAWPDWTIFER